ncbi:MAG: ATP-dependent Clp protease ATP-binding subunit [bacterium]
MYLKFTRKSEEVINNAGKFAQEMGHNYIGTEHLLLGLTSVTDSVASKSLNARNVNYDSVKKEIIKLVSVGKKISKMPPDAFTPRLKRVLNKSSDEAIASSTNVIGTEHILIALLKESGPMYGESMAIKILNIFNVSIQALQTELLTVASSNKNNPQVNAIAGGNKGKSKATSSNTPILDKFSKDFTHLALQNKFDPVEGREEEIERVIQTLTRRSKNNPCLVGEPGVGKTAIAEGLAKKIVSGDIPELLKNKRVVALDVPSVVAGSKYRGEFEDRFKKIISEVIDANNIILFIDEIHIIIGAGSAEGSIDASNILKPSLARGELRVIGATTLNEYKKYVEKDSALERRFQPVVVDEPSEEEAINMLKSLKENYELHHNVKITDSAIEACVKLSNRYITDRFLPDKAIDVLDEASSKLKLHTFIMPPDIKKTDLKLMELKKLKEEFIISEDYENASKTKVKEERIKAKLEKEKTKWYSDMNDNLQVVTEQEIADIVSSWTGIPLQKLQDDESERLKNMTSILHERIIGQEEAVDSIAKAIKRSRLGLKSPKRPIGSFLFLGPTGVGKTELSKTLSETLFGDEDAMIRVDMSEFMEKQSVAKLVGAPPGYVGYEEGGQLSEKIRRKPYSVVLFDEIEKAHHDVFNILLQVLDDGHITDSQGRKVSFKNTVIIMTSNVGARSITETKKLGFATSQEDTKKYEDMKKGVMEQVKKTFKPEFLNRIDDIIVFHTLEKEEVKQITDLMLKELVDRVKENLDITLTITEAVIDQLVEIGYDNNYGARPLRRAIQTNIEDLFTDKLLDKVIDKKDKVKVDFNKEKAEFTLVKTSRGTRLSKA